MKKTAIIGLILLTSLSLTACSVSYSSQPEFQNSILDHIAAILSRRMVCGIIKSVNGNEVTVQLGKLLTIEMTQSDLEGTDNENSVLYNLRKFIPEDETLTYSLDNPVIRVRKGKEETDGETDDLAENQIVTLIVKNGNRVGYIKIHDAENGLIDGFGEDQSLQASDSLKKN
ncbi:MAG: hypothetical protein HUJ55_06160 [Ileibacterium sp.]|nr:hypothetical protein [Ileibacterium sp.]